MIRKNAVAGIAALGLAGGLGYALRAAASGIPATNALTYAGVLEDAAGPITGSHNVQVVLYDAAAAGNNLCQSTTAVVNVVDGHFSVQLPDACTTAVGANANTWIDVLVDGSDTGRTAVGAVPYAVEAKHTPNADNATSATNAGNATNATNASNATGALGTTISSLQSSVQTLQTDESKLVDLTSTQTITGAKQFSSMIYGNLNGGNAAGIAAYVSNGGLHSISFGWNGALEIFIDNTGPQFQFGTSLSKTFVIDHPTDSERYLVHATLEGPENAVFYRGSGRLRHGAAEVTLPSYFEAATRVEGRTVLVTPTFETDDEPISGLAVSRVCRGAFLVRAIDKNSPDQAFDWEVKAVRSDVEPLVVEPKRADVAVHGDGPYRYLTPRAEKAGATP